MEIPNWIQAGVTVISLGVGALGAYHTIDNRVSVIETKVAELPQAVGELKGVVKDMDDTLDKLNTTLAVVVAKQELAEKEKDKRGR